MLICQIIQYNRIRQLRSPSESMSSVSVSDSFCCESPVIIDHCRPLMYLYEIQSHHHVPIYPPNEVRTYHNAIFWIHTRLFSSQLNLFNQLFLFPFVVRLNSSNSHYLRLFPNNILQSLSFSSPSPTILSFYLSVIFFGDILFQKFQLFTSQPFSLFNH